MSEVTRRWVVDSTNNETQKLNPVFTYRDKSGLEVSWQLYFCVLGNLYRSDVELQQPDILRSSLEIDNISLLALNVVDCNFNEFYCESKITILQRHDHPIFPVQKILDFDMTYNNYHGKVKRVFKTNGKVPNEEKIYWIFCERPHLPQPLEITFTIKECSGIGKPIPLKTAIWIADCLAAKPVTSEFQNGLWRMYEENRATDASIVVRNEEHVSRFNVHKIVLEASSPVLAATFNHEWLEKQNKEMEIVDFGVSVVEKFIKFLYTEECDLQDDDDAMQLLACADKYDVPKLKMKCQAVLAKALNVGNASKILQTADLHNANLLKDEALKFIKDHLEEVMSAPGWKYMGADLLTEVIKSAFNK